jgi:GrpB-like predicted nucleotidyltransferase (UPF0157 family)
VTTDRPPTTTEAELQAITVGPVQRLAGKIELAESDPAWPALFGRDAARIRSLLGDDIRLLEHVGSTSVDGLPAKRELAARDWEFIQQYADAKSEVVEAIIARAMADPDGATETR